MGEKILVSSKNRLRLRSNVHITSRLITRISKIDFKVIQREQRFRQQKLSELLLTQILSQQSHKSQSQKTLSHLNLSHMSHIFLHLN